MKVTYLPILLLFSLSTTLSFSQNDYEVLLHTGRQVFPENTQDYANTATIAADEIMGNHYYRLLQFYEIPSSNRLQQIKNEGIELLEYIPNKTYLASIPTNFDLDKLIGLNVRSVQPLKQDWKISHNLKTDDIPSWAKKQNRVEVILKYYKNLLHNDVLSFCEADDIKVLEENGYNNFLLATISSNEINKIAALPYIAFVELRPAPDVKDDTPGRSLHRSNAIDTNFPSGRSYTGEGVSVLTRDDGNVGPHIDFQGRLFQNNNIGLGGDHGDGVSGIFAGSGNLDPRHRGMAAGADLYVINYNASFLDNTMDLFFDQNVIVTNSSYSNGCNDGYTNTTQTVDQQIWDNPTLLHVFSAGNSNNNDCGYGAGSQWGNITGGHKQGKNVIATANLNVNGGLVGSSSRGPAHDGRIKPDIAAHGQDQVSTDPYYEYSGFGGTSAAAPGIAGITAQLHQAYSEHNNGEVANSGLLKAILLNTANDLGNEGPDFRFGWGHVNAYRAALAIENQTYLMDTIEMGDHHLHTFDVPENVAEVRIMTYWRDQSGSTFSTKALINDLNTMLIDPNGEEHLPWLLDPTPDPVTLNEPATQGVDNLNNVEQVALKNPAAGTYTLDVSGFELPFGAHGYFVVWEYRMKDITVIYPIGGERLVPFETERIHWDAEGDEGQFSLDYSLDNGLSWINISVVNGDARIYNWPIPDAITDEAMIRISRDGIEDVSDTTFNIANTPSGLQFADDAPAGGLRVEWDELEDASSYDFYILGEKYMEVVGTIDTTFYDIPTTDPFEIFWVAVSANFDNGTKSRRTIAISGGGASPVANFDISIQEPCANQPVIFTDNSMVSAGFVTYEWNFGSTSIPLAADGPGPHEVTYALLGGERTATLTVTTLSGTNTYEKSVFVNTKPSGNFSFEIGNNGEVIFTADIDNFDSVLWNFGNGDSSTEQNPVYTYPNAGQYTVEMIATNDCGDRVRTKTVDISTVFTTEVFGNLTLDVFPNPTNGQFNLSIQNVTAANDLSFELTDLQGRVIETKKLATQTGEILYQFNQTNIASGIYFLKITDRQQSVVTKVLVE